VRSKALHVALAIWLEAGMKKSRTISLTQRMTKELGLQRDSTRRARRQLEEAGLIEVEMRTGCAPVVTILD
jgi:DNA-binding transcriptional regulator YhcF (GntR family)